MAWNNTFDSAAVTGTVDAGYKKRRRYKQVQYQWYLNGWISRTTIFEERVWDGYTDSVAERILDTVSIANPTDTNGGYESLDLQYDEGSRGGEARVVGQFRSSGVWVADTTGPYGV